MKNYKSEASINKVLAEFQLANAAICDDCCEDEENFEVLLREALESENEAIKIYIKLAEKAEVLGSKLLVKAFRELHDDEVVHVGNLSYLMKLLCEDATQKQAEGETEAAKLQATVATCDNPEC